MVSAHELRRQLRLIAAPVIGLTLVGYFSYNLVEGDRGLSAWLRLTQQIGEAKATLAQVDAERRALLNRVERLQPEHLDRDLLDEEARAVLNRVAPGEVVIFDPAPPAHPAAANRQP